MLDGFLRLASLFLASAALVCAQVATHEAFPAPGTLARARLDSEGGQLSCQAVGGAPAMRPATTLIAPLPPAGAAPKSYMMPREGATWQARQIWENKLREADEEGFQWGRAIAQSAVLLAMEQTYRISDQPDTRANLKGPFVKDWINSVRGLSGWGDGDSWKANYGGHTIQGAVTGYFQIQNDPRGRLQEFGMSKSYWKSRMKAFGWAFAYSTLYELGPLSDASIGNVGHPELNPGTKGAVDLVTPTLGLALIVIEDMLDAKVVWPLEKRTDNIMAKRLMRSGFGMFRSFSNLFRLKRPWYIDSRGPVNRPALRYRQLPANY